MAASVQNLGQSKSVISDFMKKKKKEMEVALKRVLKLLRNFTQSTSTLPSDKAKDARSFMMSFQYWLGGSPQNIESMLLMFAQDFVGADVKQEIAEPESLFLTRAYGTRWHPETQFSRPRGVPGLV